MRTRRRIYRMSPDIRLKCCSLFTHSYNNNPYILKTLLFLLESYTARRDSGVVSSKLVKHRQNISFTLNPFDYSKEMFFFLSFLSKHRLSLKFSYGVFVCMCITFTTNLSILFLINFFWECIFSDQFSSF